MVLVMVVVTRKTMMAMGGVRSERQTLELLRSIALVGLVLDAYCCVKMDLFDVLKWTFWLFSAGSKF